jgi:hypothetical protein
MYGTVREPPDPIAGPAATYGRVRAPMSPTLLLGARCWYML